MRVIFICGLPGSGKTFYGNELSKETGLDFIDDIKSVDQIKQYIDSDKGCIISDPNFIFFMTRCVSELYLKQYDKKNINIEWIFFENNPEQCIKNVELRNDGRKVSGFIKHFSKAYDIPKGVRVEKVYCGV